MASANAKLRNARVQYNREMFSPRANASSGGMGVPNLFDQMFTRPMEGIDRRSGAWCRVRCGPLRLWHPGAGGPKHDHASPGRTPGLGYQDPRRAQHRALRRDQFVKKLVEVGNTVQPGQLLLNCADVEYFQVEVDVPARLRPGLREGMVVTAELDLHNRRMPVRVAQIFPVADSQRHTVKVKFDLPQGVSAPGITVQPGQLLLNCADVEYFQVEVDVPARLRPGLREGMVVTAELDLHNRRMPVRVAQIFPVADSQRHTVKVKFDLPQGVSAPGMYVKVLILDTSDSGAVARANPVIPRSAIRYNGSLPGVYVLRDSGEPQLRLIRIGEDQSGGFVTALSDLVASERVLANPGPLV